MLVNAPCVSDVVVTDGLVVVTALGEGVAVDGLAVDTGVEVGLAPVLSGTTWRGINLSTSIVEMRAEHDSRTIYSEEPGRNIVALEMYNLKVRSRIC